MKSYINLYCNACRYLLNPYSIISCAGHSTAVIDNLAVACSLWAGLTGGWGYIYIIINRYIKLSVGNSILSALFLSVATYHAVSDDKSGV